MTGFIKWVFDPANAVAVSGWGLLLGLFGTVLTVLGFALTGWQLWRTANATEAAALAVAGIKSRVATYDAIFEVSRASSALRETDRHLKRRNWPEAVDSYGDARHALVRLTELPSELDGERVTSLTDVLNEIVDFSERLEAAVLKSKDQGDVSRMINMNRKYVESLTRISIYLERGA